MVIRRKTDDIVIRTRMSTTARILTAIVAGVCIVGLVFVAYHQGLTRASLVRMQAEQRAAPLQAEIKRLQAQITEMAAENERWKERAEEALGGLARSDRQLQIDKTAYAELGASLADSNRQIAQLREELSFYRSIIAPAGRNGGIQIKDLRIQPTGDDASYHYKLVLVQALQDGDPVKGTVDFEIEGTLKGTRRVVKVPGKSDQPIEVNFRYFQSLDGVMQLPQEFLPSRIKVSVVTAGKNAPVTEEWYAWPKV